MSAIIGIVISTQKVITARDHGFRMRFSGWDHRCGNSPSRVGLIRWYRSGTPARSASRW
jgi:hypothetical protein